MKNMPLAELQNNFAKALTYGASGEQCNIASNVFTADEKIQIYRNNFIISLSDVLSATYPNVLALVGEECFAGLARQHVLNAPLLEGDVSNYGKGFSSTISSVESVISAVPYLRDVASLEWAIDDSNQKHNNPKPMPNLYPLSDLETLSAEKQSLIVLRANPAINLVDSKYAVFSIRNALTRQDFADVIIEQPEQGIAFVRSNEELLVQRLSSEEFTLLRQITERTELGRLDTTLLPYLNSLVTMNLLVGFQLHQNPGETDEQYHS
jgi:hypothetical protein